MWKSHGHPLRGKGLKEKRWEDDESQYLIVYMVYNGIVSWLSTLFVSGCLAVTFITGVTVLFGATLPFTEWRQMMTATSTAKTKTLIFSFFIVIGIA